MRLLYDLASVLIFPMVTNHQIIIKSVYVRRDGGKAFQILGKGQERQVDIHLTHAGLTKYKGNKQNVTYRGI